ncbi:hypothetical protein A2803_02735 [Candidatus Woesebacteria bacterium RIFCSPHIGHO2_01_FULL_44_21]|uniref:GH18 domain-containing protein n=1 Tax=Candidatus Woesebacteria bacterium RIFCSPHIGHO2_01_FULL_44_21 TaxID=1802503 RepID=A0A1F7YXG8_9BACT|nr:MAG: hypothetical protein A2803_02735 [Candidatus Woesebacteria bacterium RIFCSPHIGHO2_01_FULL_44_21]OGM69811.1 MAG: hypothetical protein A2897_00510 [Candidatus Woesebacteria bacterium RIFCSPLOWO2_01_FULL_44_24b]
MKYALPSFFLLTSFFTVVFVLVANSINLSPSRAVDNIKKSLAYSTSDIESEYSAWVPWWDEPASINSLKNSNNQVKTILPVWYQINEAGKLIETDSKLKEEVLKVAKELNISVVPTISNASGYDFDGERISKLLGSEELREGLVANLLELAQKNAFRGWDLDWEQVKKEDREAYSSFVDLLGKRLNSKNLKLSVTVHAQAGKVSDWDGTSGQDLKAIGNSANYVRVMAYDFHHSKSSPGSVTPMDRLSETLEYSAKVIPLDKLVLGLPSYGYDWIGDEGTAMQYEKIVDYLGKNGIQSQRDSETYSLYANFDLEGAEHALWYEDAESFHEKVKLAKSYGVYQVTLWHLGGEDPRIWAY